MRHLIAVSAAALLLLLAAVTHLAHAQSEPSISIELSPDHFVPMDTAITGTVTLRGLDPAAYSSVVFRADITPYSNGERRCNGDDTGTDIEIPVNSSSSTFTARIYDACPSQYHSYGTYTLDLTVSRLNDTAPGGRVELAAAQTQFGMSRYLAAGEAVPAPPTPGAVAWTSPDPTTLGMRALGEWHYFRFHSDVTKYLNDHMGVRMYSAEPGHFATGGGVPEHTPSESPADACQNEADNHVHYRRAIHQGLWVVACRAGDATISLRHETEAVAPLYTYRFATLPADSPLSIAGRAQVGHTLTADTADITDPDGLTAPGYTYQWLADDVAIAGANASTYTLVAADEGRAIKVTVSFTDDKGNGHTLTSAATTAVAPAPIIPNRQPPPPPNRPPVADAGPDQTVNEGDTVTLDGSSSSDPDPGDALTYSWRSDGSAPTALTGRNPTFVAPAVDSQQRIVLTLAVSDGSLTDTDTVVITVRDAPPPGTIIPPPLPGTIILPQLILPPLPPLLPDTTPPITLPTGSADPRGSMADCLTLVFNVIFGGPVAGADRADSALPPGIIFQTANRTSSPALTVPDQQAAGDAIAARWPGAAAQVTVELNIPPPVTNGPIVWLTSPDCAAPMPHNGTTSVPGAGIFDAYGPDFNRTDAAGNWTLVIRDSRGWLGGILNEWSPGMDAAGALPGSGRPYLVTAYAGLMEPTALDAAGDRGTAGKAGNPLALLIPEGADRTYTVMAAQRGAFGPAACR